jgi:hypothetical protein
MIHWGLLGNKPPLLFFPTTFASTKRRRREKGAISNPPKLLLKICAKCLAGCNETDGGWAV